MIVGQAVHPRLAHFANPNLNPNPNMKLTLMNPNPSPDQYRLNRLVSGERLDLISCLLGPPQQDAIDWCLPRPHRSCIYIDKLK